MSVYLFATRFILDALHVIGSSNNNGAAANWALSAQTTCVSVSVYLQDTYVHPHLWLFLASEHDVKRRQRFPISLCFSCLVLYFIFPPPSCRYFIFSLQLNWHAQVPTSPPPPPPPQPTLLAFLTALLTAGGTPFDRLPNCNWNAKVLSPSTTAACKYRNCCSCLIYGACVLDMAATFPADHKTHTRPDSPQNCPKFPKFLRFVRHTHYEELSKVKKQSI